MCLSLSGFIWIPCSYLALHTPYRSVYRILLAVRILLPVLAHPLVITIPLSKFRREMHSSSRCSLVSPTNKAHHHEDVVRRPPPHGDQQGGDRSSQTRLHHCLSWSILRNHNPHSISIIHHRSVIVLWIALPRPEITESTDWIPKFQWITDNWMVKRRQLHNWGRKSEPETVERGSGHQRQRQKGKGQRQKFLTRITVETFAHRGDGLHTPWRNLFIDSYYSGHSLAPRRGSTCHCHLLTSIKTENPEQMWPQYRQIRHPPSLPRCSVFRTPYLDDPPTLRLRSFVRSIVNILLTTYVHR